MLLKKGMYNNDSVLKLQKALDRLGYSLAIDGDFGGGTEKAVKQFQRDHNLNVDGIAGKDTLGKLVQLHTEVPQEAPNQRVLLNTDLLHHYEDCKLEAYLCPAGIWTIGWGSTGNHVYKGLVITQEEADQLFIKDCERFVESVNTYVKVPLTQYEFDALVTFAYNVGCSNFESSTLLKKLNIGDYQGASDEFLRWNKSKGKVLKGLTYRRQSERHYFLTGEVKYFNI